MEVYATIFMIFVSHVLSSFTQTFSSRLKDGRDIAKIRRMVYFQDHYNCEHNQGGTVEGIAPLLSREKRANNDDDVKLKRGRFINIESHTFVSSSEKNNFRLYRKKKLSAINQDAFPSSSTNQIFNCFPNNTKVDFIKSDENKTLRQASTPLPFPEAEAWSAKRAKGRYVTVRPWNQYCSKCFPSTEHADKCIKIRRTRATKRKKRRTTCQKIVVTSEGENQPWLFFVKSTKAPGSLCSPKQLDKCSSKATVSHKKLECCDNNNKNSCIDNLYIRKKKYNYFLPANGYLDIVQSAKKRYKETRKNRHIPDLLPKTHLELIGKTNGSEKRKLDPSDINFFHNNLLNAVKQLREAGFKQIKKGNLAESIRHRRMFKSVDKGIPPCQKSCFHNLTNLVNAQTILPAEKYIKRPSIVLCCSDEEDNSSSAPSVASTKAKVTSSLKPDDSSTNITDDSNMAGTATIAGDLSSLGTSNIDQVSTTVSDLTTNPPGMRMLIKLRTIIPKKQKIFSKNKEGQIDSDMEGSKSESRPKSLCYLISYESNDTLQDSPLMRYVMKTANPRDDQPWDKYCPNCEGEPSTIPLDIAAQPWVSTCCYSINYTITTLEHEAFGTLRPRIRSKTTPPVNMRLIVPPGPPVVHKPVEAKYIQNLSPFPTNRSDIKTLVVIRVPVGNTKTSQEILNINLANNKYTSDASHTKRIRARSIFDQFLPSLLRKPTMRTIDLINPWEDSWGFKQEKFNLFTTCSRSINSPISTNEPPFLSKNLFELFAETSLSYPKDRLKSLFKTTCNYKQLNDNEKKEQLNDGEVDNGFFKLNENTIEKAYPKYVSYVWRFPGVDLINNCSLPMSKVKSKMNGLTILQSLGSPPKYYVEVPELWPGLRNLAEKGGSSSTCLSIAEKSKERSVKLRHVGPKKALFLYLQPFEVNGNEVYLPQSELDSPHKDKLSGSTYTGQTVIQDYQDFTSYPRSKHLSPLVHKKDSVLPFFLVPAYLAMDPNIEFFASTTTVAPKLGIEDLALPFEDLALSIENVTISTEKLAQSSEDQITFLEKQKDCVEIQTPWPGVCSENSSPTTMEMDYDLSILNDNISEKRNNKMVNPQHSTFVTKINKNDRIGVTRKLNGILGSKRPRITSPRPAYIILMNGLDDAPFPQNQLDDTSMDQKGGATNEPFGKYVLI